MSASSILLSVKKNLGIEEDFTEFDQDIVMHINTILNVLTQIGVGPSNGFQIEDASSSWSDFIDDQRLNMVRTYVYARVRLIFDPPQLTSVTECLKETIKELECRLSYAVNPPDTFDNKGGEKDVLCGCTRE